MATSYSYYIDTESRTLRKADEEHGRLEKADAPRFNFGETPHFSLSFPEGTFGAGDVIVMAIDTDKNLLGTAPMSMVEHLVTSDEAAAQTIELDMPTRTQRFIDAMDNRPFEVRVFFEVSRHYETVNDDGEDAGESGTTQMADLLCDDYAYAKASVAQYGDPLVVLPSQYYYKKAELDAIADGMEQIKEDAESARDTAIEAKEGAEENATLARSYARGDTGSREGEGTDNALYYKGQAETAKTDAETAKAGAIDAKNAASVSNENAKAWAEGTDAQVQALGGEHSAKGWAEHIDTNYVPLSQKGAANGVAQLDSSGKVPTTQLPDISGGKIDAITVNGEEVPIVGKTANITIDSDDVGALPADSTGAMLGLSIDPQTYVMTLQLKNNSGTVLDTKTVDLPLETMVVSASCADRTLTLTLQNGQTLDVDVSDIVSGLIPSSEKGANNGVATLDGTGKVPDSQLSSNAINAIDAITFNGSAVPVTNKTANITAAIPTALSQLSQDSTHRTVTDAEKTTWNNKSDFSGSYDDLTDKPSLDYIPQTNKGAANGVAPLDSNSLVPDENLPALAPLPLHLNAAPTTSTVGVFGQHAIVASTGKEYTCVAVATADDVTTYTWTDDINAKGGTFTGNIVVGTAFPVGIKTTGGLYVGPSTNVSGAGGVFAAGNNARALRGNGCTALGFFAYSTKDSQLVTGRANCQIDGARLTGGGVNNVNRRNIEELDWDGNHLIMGGRQQEITEIPPATTEYTLKEGQQKHAPSEASTYVLPAIHARCIIVEGRWCRHEDSKDGTGYYGWVTTYSSSPTSWDEKVYYTANRYPAAGEMAYGNTALTAGATAISLPPDITHECILTIDFTTVQTYAFADSQGNAIAPLFTPTIAAGDVYEFRCEYSAIQSKWLIYPCKQGAVSDDYVMQAEVGAANGVAGLDSNGTVLEGELPIAGNNTRGAIKVNSNLGHQVNENGILYNVLAANQQIDSRLGVYTVIAPPNLNYAVTAALTDANHITLTSAQQQTAQSVLGIDAPVVFTTAGDAPTTSTVGTPGRRAVNTADGKAWTCTAVTNTGTEAEPVWSYTWTDDVNAMGGTIVSAEGLIVKSSANSVFSTHIYGDACIAAGYSVHVSSSTSVAIGRYVSTIGRSGALTIGTHVVGVQNHQVVTGTFNELADAVFVVGGGTAQSQRNLEELDWDGNLTIYGGQRQIVHVIPPETTAYTLTEGVQSHIPISASTYTLPELHPLAIIITNMRYIHSADKDGTGYYGWVSADSSTVTPAVCYTANRYPVAGEKAYMNTALTQNPKAISLPPNNRTHECILDVKFDNVQTLVFQDADGNVIEPQDDIDIQQGDVWRFLCQWNTLLECWCIMPVKLQNKTILPPVLSISPSSYSVEGNEGSALDDLDLSENVTVQHPVTGSSLSFSSSDLPAGVSISSAGVISGTPTAQGTTTSTITIAYPNATSITCTVVFTIAGA